jgi:hypothetical protein
MGGIGEARIASWTQSHLGGSRREARNEHSEQTNSSSKAQHNLPPERFSSASMIAEELYLRNSPQDNKRTIGEFE